MVAINYLEDDHLTQKEATQRYGYTGGWLSQWLNRLERLAVVRCSECASTAAESR